MADDHRSSHRRRDDAAAEPSPPHPTEDAVLEEEACSRLLLEGSLRKLSEPERQVVSLHLIADLPLREVARILDEPLGTVAWRNRQAMGKLRRMMMEREEWTNETTI